MQFLNVNVGKKGNGITRARALFAVIVAFAAIALAYFTCLQLAQGNSALAEVSVGGRSYNVYLAITPEQQEKGLMNATSMGDCDGNGNCLGMLFVNLPSPACFWMKDTVMPLRQYWISDGTISYIWAGVPESTQVVCSNGNVVLETNASTNFTVGESFAVVKEFG